MTLSAETRPGHQHPGYATAPRQMRVLSVMALTDQISHFRLAPLDDAPLIPFQPGSHLIVSAGEHRNAYSLVDDGFLPESYGISVLRLGHGGGSDWLHDQVSAEDVIEVEGPRSMFGPIANQQHTLLVAGGIGVTPILSHARAALRHHTSAEIIYSYRPGQAGHLEDLRQLAENPQITLYEVSGVEETQQLLEERFRLQPLGTHAYACGPAPMLEAYVNAAESACWPPARVHLERFSAPELDPGEAFTVTLASTGESIEVPAGVSLLQSLLDKGLPVPNLCRQGVCGECRIGVRSGDLEHRDLVLTDEERASGKSMLSCVSRGTDIEVEL